MHDIDGDYFSLVNYALFTHNKRTINAQYTHYSRTINAQYTHYSRTIPITSVAEQWESQPKTLNCRRFAPSSKLRHIPRLYTLNFKH